MKKLFKILLFVALFLALERFCHHQTRGFSISNIYGTELEIKTFAGELPELVGPFTFLDSGLECYAFLSADKKHVLKFFKQHHVREADALARFLPILSKMREQKRERLENCLRSCQIAYEELREESGLLYIHLAKTENQLPAVTLIDKLGIKHAVPLDGAKFLVQKRADKLMTTLNSPCAKEAISSLLKLIDLRCQKGIADRDPTLLKNFGFIEDQAIVIDLGSFSKDPFLKEKNRRNRTLFYETLPLKCLLTKHHPELLPHFEHELQKLITL